MDNKGKFRVGTRFVGNVNKVPMEVVRIEGKNVIIKNLLNGQTFICGLRTLEKCYVTISEN